MRLAGVLVLLAGPLGAQEMAARPLFEVGQRVELTIADQYRGDGVAVEEGRLEFRGRLVARSEKVLTVALPDEWGAVRYPAGGAFLAGTVVALDGEWLTLDLGDRRPHVRVPLSAIVGASVPAAREATEGALKSGAWVRLHFVEPGRPSITGRVLEVDDGSLLLGASGRLEPLRLEQASIQRLEVRREERGSVGGAILFGCIGAALGGVMGGFSNYECGSNCNPAAPFLGAAMGGLAGGMVGSLTGSHVEWRAVPRKPVNVSVVPGPRGGLSASLSLRF